MWAMNPLPAAAGDYPAPCPGKTPVRGPAAYQEWGSNPNECSGNWPTTVYIEDTIKIPTDIEAVPQPPLSLCANISWPSG